jgi:hypothetical protein
MNISYIFPPRPETKIAPSSLELFDKMGVYIAEPKLNGSSMEIYFSADGKEIKTMNRHKQPMECKIDKAELLKLYRGKGEMILCGEYLNKNQKDETGKPWNIKYVIWDIIKYDGKHLLGTTFEERYILLQTLYITHMIKPHMHKISDNCYRVDAIYKSFKGTYDNITKWDMFEGLVMKRKDGKLENGTTAGNNTRTQIKCRKPTSSYNF